MLDLAELLEQKKDAPLKCPSCNMLAESEDILRDHYKQVHNKGRTWKELAGRKDGDEAYKFGELPSYTVTAHRRPYAIGSQLGTPAKQREPLLETAQRPHGRSRQLPVRRPHDERRQGSSVCSPADR